MRMEVEAVRRGSLATFQALGSGSCMNTSTRSRKLGNTGQSPDAPTKMVSTSCFVVKACSDLFSEIV